MYTEIEIKTLYLEEIKRGNTWRDTLRIVRPFKILGIEKFKGGRLGNPFPLERRLERSNL